MKLLVTLPTCVGRAIFVSCFSFTFQTEIGFQFLPVTDTSLRYQTTPVAVTLQTKIFMSTARLSSGVTINKT